MEHLARVLQAAAALAWPLVVLFVVCRFRKSADDILQALGSRLDKAKKIKAGGFELTVADIRTQDAKLVQDLQDRVFDLEQRLTSAKAESPEESQLSTSNARSTPTLRRVLWVDDNPMNNAALIEQLRLREVDVDTAVSTDEGLKRAGEKKYAAIITDMSRGSDYDAGITLTKSIRAHDEVTPIVVYCGPRSARAKRQDALNAGANEVTASATALMGFLREKTGAAD
jgi:CheY-like chemotaxis protein